MPIRLRVTLAFSGVMAVLLVALGLFIHLRFKSHLDRTIDEGLKTHANDVAALFSQNRAALTTPQTKGIPSRANRLGDQ